MGKLLSMDLSTITAGYCIFDEETEKLELMSYYSFDNKTELIERAVELNTLLTKLIKEHNITKFIVEENLKSFRSAGTNADAMLKTSKLNFLCCYFIKYVFKIDLYEVNVMNARGSCFPGFHKISRARKGVKDKEIAFEMVRAKLGEDKFPTKVLASGPRKGTTVFLDQAGDMSDSWVIGRSYFVKKEKGEFK